MKFVTSVQELNIEFSLSTQVRRVIKSSQTKLLQLAINVIF